MVDYMITCFRKAGQEQPLEKRGKTGMLTVFDETCRERLRHLVRRYKIRTICQIPKTELEMEDCELHSADMFRQLFAHHLRAHV